MYIGGIIKKIGFLIWICIVAQFISVPVWAQTAMDAMGATSIHNTLQGTRAGSTHGVKPAKRAKAAVQKRQQESDSYKEYDTSDLDSDDNSNYNDDDEDSDSSSDESDDDEE